MALGLGSSLNTWCWGSLLTLPAKFTTFLIRVWMARTWVLTIISGPAALNLSIMLCCNSVFSLRFLNRLTTSSLLGGVWSPLSLLSNLAKAGRRWSNEDNRSSTNCSLKIVPWNCLIKGILSFIVMVSSEIAMLGCDNHLQFQLWSLLRMASSVGSWNAGP